MAAGGAMACSSAAEQSAGPSLEGLGLAAPPDTPAQSPARLPIDGATANGAVSGGADGRSDGGAAAGPSDQALPAGVAALVRDHALQPVRVQVNACA